MTTTSTNLISKIIEANKTQDAVALEEAIIELRTLPVIVRYYIIKGFKLADETLFYSFIAFVRGTDFWEDDLRVILVGILQDLYTEEDNNEAYTGIGKVQDYVDYYASIV